MSKAKKVAITGLLFAVAIALSWLENLIPTIPGLPPGIKLGLSNIVVLFCIYYVALPYSVSLVVLKALFVFLIRGFSAAVLSFSGGILSVIVMALIVYLSKKRCSYGLVSVCGACAHNVGQLVMASVIILSPAVYYYTPILLASGIVMGLITGYIFVKLSPYIDSKHIF